MSTVANIFPSVTPQLIPVTYTVAPSTVPLQGILEVIYENEEISTQRILDLNGAPVTGASPSATQDGDIREITSTTVCDGTVQLTRVDLVDPTSMVALSSFYLNGSGAVVTPTGTPTVGACPVVVVPGPTTTNNYMVAGDFDSANDVPTGETLISVTVTTARANATNTVTVDGTGPAVNIQDRGTWTWTADDETTLDTMVVTFNASSRGYVSYTTTS